jgi:C4-type Zn-finger protein
MIECDKCKAQMEQTAKEEHIPNTELDIQYIQCEQCGKKYIVLLKDNKTKGMLIRIRNMQDRYRRMYGRKNVAEVEAYRKHMENYQRTIQRYQLQLRNNNKNLIKDYL